MLDKDLYDILDIKKDANDAEIRKAFHRLAKKCHPDVNPGNKDAEQRFKEINFAYEVLKNKKRRAQYDEMRRVGANPFAGGQTAGGWAGRGAGSEGFSDMGLGDLFQEIFGGSFDLGGFGSHGRTRAGRTVFRSRGADREVSLTISFIEAAKGGERVIDLGGGKRLTVKIPEGIDDGVKIKLTGQGGVGVGGGPAGDLLLAVQVAPHPFFRREQNHVILPLPVTFSEAVLGAEIEVPTIHGKVTLKLPSGISSGQRLRLAGKGIRSPKTHERGDQFVEIAIKIPKHADADYCECAEKLRVSAFNPRESILV